MPPARPSSRSPAPRRAAAKSPSKSPARGSKSPAKRATSKSPAKRAASKSPKPAVKAAAPKAAVAGAIDVTSWLLFLAVLVNQAGRVMVPAVKTSLLADPAFGSEFEASVGSMLSGVSIVCLAGKLLGAAVTDQLGGWLVLAALFVGWICATVGAVTTSSVSVFGGMWLLNSLAYTVCWGSAVQVVGATYSDAERPAQLSFLASASRFGAMGGNVLFGQLLSAGLHWRTALMPMLPLQVALLVFCGFKYARSAPAAATAGTGRGRAVGKPPSGASVFSALRSIDFWLMLLPKAILFTYTQFFMNYMPQLLHAQYGYGHGGAASMGGIAQGGSVVGLLVVGNVIYKKLPPTKKVALVALLLAACAVVPAVLALGPSAVPAPLVVPLCCAWGLAYALPFYIPPGEFAMHIGGKTSTALFTNLFDATGFLASALWNPWASALARQGDFRTVLLSQALFGAISLGCMPLCMYRQLKRAKAK